MDGQGTHVARALLDTVAATVQMRSFTHRTANVAPRPPTTVPRREAVPAGNERGPATGPCSSIRHGTARKLAGSAELRSLALSAVASPLASMRSIGSRCADRAARGSKHEENMMVPRILAILAILAVSACGDDDDAATANAGGSSTGGSNAGGRAGGSAGALNNGGSAGTTTGGAGGAGGGAGVACANCVTTNCMTSAVACYGNTDCQAILTCARPRPARTRPAWTPASRRTQPGRPFSRQRSPASRRTALPTASGDRDQSALLPR